MAEEEFIIRVNNVAAHYPAEMRELVVQALLGNGYGPITSILFTHAYLGVFAALKRSSIRMKVTRVDLDPNDPKSMLVTVVVGRGSMMIKKDVCKIGRMFGAKV